jgi:hypothetical protein
VVVGGVQRHNTVVMSEEAADRLGSAVEESFVPQFDHSVIRSCREDVVLHWTDRIDVEAVRGRGNNIGGIPIVQGMGCLSDYSQLLLFHVIHYELSVPLSAPNLTFI